jgi:hypothetical protein
MIGRPKSIAVVPPQNQANLWASRAASSTARQKTQCRPTQERDTQVDHGGQQWPGNSDLHGVERGPGRADHSAKRTAADQDPLSCRFPSALLRDLGIHDKQPRPNDKRICHLGAVDVKLAFLFVWDSRLNVRRARKERLT